MLVFMRKNILKFVVFAFVFALPINAFAGDNEKIKVAIVDLQKVEEGSLISKDLQKKMRSKEEELGKDLIKRKGKIEQEFKALEGKRAVLSGEELQKKAKKLESDFQKLQMDEKIYLQTFDIARNESLKVMQDNVKKAVNKVADNYDLVIPSNLALYVNTSKFDDLTSKVKNEQLTIDQLSEDIKEQVDKTVEQQRKQAKK